MCNFTNLKWDFSTPVKILFRYPRQSVFTSSKNSSSISLEAGVTSGEYGFLCHKERNKNRSVIIKLDCFLGLTEKPPLTSQASSVFTSLVDYIYWMAQPSAEVCMVSLRKMQSRAITYNATLLTLVFSFSPYVVSPAPEDETERTLGITLLISDTTHGSL